MPLKKTVFAVLFLLLFTGIAFAQQKDSLHHGIQLSGAASITNNGISLVPSFSLEQPAAVFNMSLQKGRFSFDPEFSFSLQEGRPWYQLFWFRYRVIDSSRFHLTAGTHLGLNFRSALQPAGSDPRRLITVERYLVGELVPTYTISKKVNVGMYYLLARGFDIGTRQLTHFVTLNAAFNQLPMGNKLHFSIAPQVFYLYLYGQDGWYATSTFTAGMQNVPFTLSSTINKAIATNIAGKDFLWNLTLRYAFGRGEFTPKRFLK